MKNQTKILSSAFFLALVLLASLTLVSASLVIEEVSQENLYPGSEANLDIEVSNDLGYDLKDVKMTLVFNYPSQTGVIDLSKPTSFSSVGSSSDSVDEIEDEDSEFFIFNIKASNSLEPGDYSLGYVLNYENDNKTLVTETGTIGITVNSKTNLDYSISQEKKVMGMKDKVTLKIINKGFGEVKFVSVDVDSPEGYTLLSEDKVYIGSISSDDSDTASFEVILNKANPSFSATITYKDFENNDKSQIVNFDLTAYSREKALELGIIQKNNTPIVLSVLVILLILWLLFRWLRKRRKAKLAKARKENSY